MNVKERFENIISHIDAQIRAASPKDDAMDICERAVFSAGEKDILEASAAFHFLTGQALIPYIRSRTAALTEGTEAEGLSWEKISERELADGEADAPEDLEAIEKAAGQNAAHSDDYMSSLYEDLDLDFTLFQQPVPEYDPVEDLTLKTAWGFSENQISAVENARKNRNLSLPEAYKFVSDLTDQLAALASGYDAVPDDLLYLSNEFDLTVNETIDVYKKLDDLGVKDIQGEPRDIIAVFLSAGIPYEAVRNIYQEYLNNNIRASFEEFIERAKTLGSVEEAVASFNNPEEEEMMKGFFDMISMGFEDLNYYSQNEAEMLKMENEAKEDGFVYDFSAGDDFTDF